MYPFILRIKGGNSRSRTFIIFIIYFI